MQTLLKEQGVPPYYLNASRAWCGVGRRAREDGGILLTNVMRPSFKILTEKAQRENFTDTSQALDVEALNKKLS